MDCGPAPPASSWLAAPRRRWHGKLVARRTMLVLFETPAGYALFEVKNEKKLKKVEKVFAEFETPER